MYTRELKPAPLRPVVVGKPAYGSYTGFFGDLDICGMKRPFGGIPFPVFLTNVRVMETLRFIYCDENDIGEIEIFNARYFAFMETTIWNRKTGHRLAYRRLIPPGLVRVPGSFDSGVTACRTRKRYVRIHARVPKNSILADFDFLGSNSRPPCEGSLEMDLSRPDSAKASFLVPYEVKRRCLASCQATAPLHGWLSTRFDDHRISLDAGVGFYDARKAYYSLRTKISALVGLGRIDGRIVSFQLGNSVSYDDNRYNDNVLFDGGTIVPLPPVKITRPKGVSGDWMIQDTESMVDLVFTPLSDSSRYLSAFFLRTDYHTVYGIFNGVLLTGDGKKIVLKDYPGIGKKVRLRI